MSTGTPDITADPGAYDVPHCDQYGIGPDGKPVADDLTGTGSDAKVTEFDPDNLLLDQARREVLEAQLEINRIRTAMDQINARRVLMVEPDGLTPLSFPL